jgi:glycosyltransferase involved in cell wall biosynthesis
MSDPSPVISIVIPVYNNRPAVLRATADELLAELGALPGPAEVVFVDDGSGDQTKAALAELVRLDSRVRVVELVANFGQHAALSAGFDRARGRMIVTMDGDGQCDPRDIPKLLAPLFSGFDMVSGVRLQRKDPSVR